MKFYTYLTAGLLFVSPLYLTAEVKGKVDLHPMVSKIYRMDGGRDSNAFGVFGGELQAEAYETDYEEIKADVTFTHQFASKSAVHKQNIKLGYELNPADDIYLRPYIGATHKTIMNKHDLFYLENMYEDIKFSTRCVTGDLGIKGQIFFSDEIALNFDFGLGFGNKHETINIQEFSYDSKPYKSNHFVIDKNANLGITCFICDDLHLLGRVGMLSYADSDESGHTDINMAIGLQYHF